MSELTFEEISLTKDETELLTRIAEEGPALAEDGNRAALTRMERLGLVEIFPVTNPALLEEARKKSGDLIPKAAYITGRGRDYLAYLAAKDADSRRDFRRDVLMLLIGAVITLLFDRLPLLAEFLKGLFQGG